MSEPVGVIPTTYTVRTSVELDGPGTVSLGLEVVWSGRDTWTVHAASIQGVNWNMMPSTDVYLYDVLVPGGWERGRARALGIAERILDRVAEALRTEHAARARLGEALDLTRGNGRNEQWWQDRTWPRRDLAGAVVPA